LQAVPNAFPTFLIVGAAKSGSTSLWKGVQSHPDVFVSPTKEVHFFDEDENWDRGQGWYRSFFRGHYEQRAVGEATPTYMSSPAAPARMGQTVPAARLVAILRDPVRRAYSQYFQMRYYGWESRTFDEAVADELKAPGWNLEPRYLAIGRYASQLERLGDHFERDQILVVITDDMRAALAATYQRVFAHIGVDPLATSVPNIAENGFREVRFESLARKLRASRVARGASPRTWDLMVRMFTRTGGAPPPMDPRTRRMLDDAFGEENARLAAWLGRDLSAWTAPE
jgi:hypothetical protein